MGGLCPEHKIKRRIIEHEDRELLKLILSHHQCAIRNTGFFFIPEKLRPYYSYFIKEYASSLDRTSQIAFYHQLINLDPIVSASILGVSERQLKKILRNIQTNILEFLKDYMVIKRDDEVYINYYNSLINNDYDDDELATRYNEDIAAIKISRVLTLKLLSQNSLHVFG